MCGVQSGKYISMLISQMLLILGELESRDVTFINKDYYKDYAIQIYPSIVKDQSYQ